MANSFAGKDIIRYELRENMRKEINRINLGRWMGGRQESLSGGSKGDV